MKQQFDTYEQAIDKIAEIDELMGFPDNTGTQTWAVPEKVEVDGLEKWEVIMPESETSEK
jgi:hypothetical protein